MLVNLFDLFRVYVKMIQDKLDKDKDARQEQKVSKSMNFDDICVILWLGKSWKKS